MVYLLPFSSYLAGYKGESFPRVRPSDPDTMTNTALEAIASSSGKNEHKEMGNYGTHCGRVNCKSDIRASFSKR